MKQLDLSDSIFVKGKAHYWIDVGSHRVAYCYIRKNACSAFKALVRDTSQFSDGENERMSGLDFMNKFHRIKDFDTLESCDIKLFVYRDPYERLISVFLNKFIVQTGNVDIFRHYSEQIGSAPESATFREFVTDFCKPPLKSRDPHIFPQSMHLLPVRYNAAIELSSLHKSIEMLLGKKVADGYFLTKKNSTEYGEDKSQKIDVPCKKLKNQYSRTGHLPSKACFMSDELKSIVTKRYSRDYRMIDLMKSV